MDAQLIPLTQAALPSVAARGVPVPGYDRARLRPRIVHVGLGGFARAHLAGYTHATAAAGGDWGIHGLGLLPGDARMAAILTRQDHLFTLVERGPGEPRASVLGSVTGFTLAAGADEAAAVERIAAPETAILSLTITEAGYAEAAGPEGGPPSTFDRIALGLAARRDRGLGPLTILSCDNLPANGAAAREATLAAAQRLDPAVAAWVGEHCTFPSSMVDRITPVTAEADRAWLRDAHGVVDAWPVVAEPFRQWVLEDVFAAGRPAWEDDGVLLTSGVHAWELYKLRFLNAGHSGMAYLAALAGLEFVDEAVRVPAVRGFLDALLIEEALPTLAPIPGHPREDYIAIVLERFENQGTRDQIARLCIDGTAKFPTFLVPTITGQLERGGPVTAAATALAGWARYLFAVPAQAQAHDASAAEAREHAAAAAAEPRAFLQWTEVFGPVLAASPRFAQAFEAAYRRIVEAGPLAAMAAVAERPPVEVPG